jgi:hypothetical protein
LRSPEGSFTSIDVPGSSGTAAFDINEASQIVGEFYDASGTQGFLLSGGSFTPIEVPDSSLTRVFSINKTGEIVGSFRDTNTAHGFLAILQTITVDILIKPAEDPNTIKLSAKGTLPVAILTTTDFDAADVDPSTVTLGDDDGDDTPVATRASRALMTSLQDVDGDGDLDRVLFFGIQALVTNSDLDKSSTELILNGKTSGGQAIQGSDTVSSYRKIRGEKIWSLGQQTRPRGYFHWR